MSSVFSNGCAAQVLRTQMPVGHANGFAAQFEQAFKQAFKHCINPGY
jgi:hypothetical protein